MTSTDETERHPGRASSLGPRTTSRLVPTRLGRLHVQVTEAEEADAPTVAMWPALMLDHTVWDEQVAHLSERYRTVAIDPPGHGRSDPLVHDISLEECTGALLDLLDELEVDRAHLMGNSWGAIVAADTAATHPGRVASAVLMNGTSTTAPRLQQGSFTVLTAAARTLRGFRAPLVELVVHTFLGPTSRRHRPWAVERVRELASRADPRSITHVTRRIVVQREDQRVRLADVRCPVLVVASIEDPTFPLSEVSRVTAAIPGAVQVVAPDAGHLVALEVPEWANAQVTAFLDEVESGRGRRP